MKKLGLILLMLIVATACFAGINKQLTQINAINILKASKSKALSVSTSLSTLRQNIEDTLADELTNLDESDQTKLIALITEIQDIIDEANDLIVKIETHYPEVD